MAQKNRPTLKQQFSDFINRVAPFDVNPLIQKTEHLQVEDDLFDSLLNKNDSSVLINSPAELINLDFESVDLYRINTSGSVDTDFVFTPSNIGTGQVGRIDIIKKNNDTFSFSNAVLAPIDNLNQTGAVLSFWVHNINGTYIVGSALNIAKSDNINANNSNQLATSKAIRDLNTVVARKNTTVTGGGGLGGGGDLSANRIIEIADSGVTTDKINGSAVTAGKIASSAVTTPKIENGAVNHQKASSSIVKAPLLAAQIGNANITASGNTMHHMGGTTSNRPSGFSRGVLITFDANLLRFQMAFEDDKLYARESVDFGTTWTAWKSSTLT